MPLTADGQVRRLLPQVSATVPNDEAVEIWKSGRGRPSAEVEGPRRCDRTPQRHDFTIEEPPLFSIAKCRRLLGVFADSLSDEQIAAIQNQLRPLASIALLTRRRGLSQRERSSSQPSLSTDPESKDPRDAAPLRRKHEPGRPRDAPCFRSRLCPVPFLRVGQRHCIKEVGCPKL
jgi:hypothetical protein